MEKLTNDVGRGRRWITAIVRGMVVCFLAAILLTIAVKLSLPYITDAIAVALVITAWIISIGLGIREVLKHRPKS